jgi:DNA polymerase I-like protein with 3'-5' exonuclease and polymerase domains/uracil-DNA glycosylase
MEQLQLENLKMESPNCETCGLFRNCQNPFLRPVVDMRLQYKNTNCILVVGDYADGPDDRNGRYFNSNGRGYKIIQDLLGDLECRYVFTTALACGLPNPKNTKLGVKQYRSCFEEKLKPLVIKHRPRVIIFLGTTAMNAGLQNKAPKSLKAITQTGMNITWNEGTDEEINSLIMAVDHPARFLMEKTDVERLAKLYETVFKKAEQYCLKTDVRVPTEFELIDNPARLYSVAGLPFTEMSFDIENTYAEKDHTKNTLWKRNAKLLSLSITYFEQVTNAYRTFVVVGDALKNQICLERLFKDRIAIAHNIKHDAQGMWRLAGVDIFSLVKDYHDTLALFYLSDQNRLDNGLKPLTAHYLNIHDYVDEVKIHVTEANKRISDLRKNLTAQIKEKRKHLLWLEELAKHNAGLVVLAKPKLKKISLLRDQYGSIEDVVAMLEILEKQLSEVPIEGSADYGDIPIAVLAEYNADDTLATLRLYREILPYLSKHDSSFNQQDPLWTEEAYSLYKRSVRMACYVERNGLPMDMESLDEMNKDLLEKEKELRSKLFKSEIIQKAILDIPQIKEREEKGQLTEELMLKELSPTKAKFMTNLCHNIGVSHLGGITKSGNISYTSKGVVKAIKDHFDEVEDPELSEIFKDFVYLGNSKQVRSKFVKNWKTYYVPEDSCFHCNFLLTKNNNYLKGGHSEGANGRTSSTNINTQQIRKVGYLRKHFKAPPGYVFVEIDYASLEPVLISFLSNCDRLKDIFRRKLDIYQVTANDIYDLGVNLNASDDEVREALKAQVTDSFRDKLKIGFLAWCYGRGKPSFMRDMKITEEECDHFYNTAYEMYREVYHWKEGIKDTLENGELITTMFGRKRSFPIRPPAERNRDDFFRWRKEFAKALRVAVNFPVQSLGSDICLWNASFLQEWIQQERLENVIKIVNLVHDAVWLLVKENQMDWALPECQKIMEDTSKLPFRMDVPLRTSADWGPSLASYLKESKKQMFLPY